MEIQVADWLRQNSHDQSATGTVRWKNGRSFLPAVSARSILPSSQPSHRVNGSANGPRYATVQAAGSGAKDAMREGPAMTSRPCDRDVITGPALIPTVGPEAAACTAHRRQDYKGPLGRFADKRERLNHLRETQLDFQKQVASVIEGKLAADKLKWKIMSCKMRIELLKQSIWNGSEEIAKNSELLSKSKKYNQELYLRSQRHQEKKEKIQRRNHKLSVVVEKRSKDLKSRHAELASLRRAHILELTSVIFPIGEVKNVTSEDIAESVSHTPIQRCLREIHDKVRLSSPTSSTAGADRCNCHTGISLARTLATDPADVSFENDNAMTSSTVSKLAEARRTTYLSGRWVCDDHNGDTSISIAGPWITLPNNGDYSAYYNWVEEKKTTPGPACEPVTDQEPPVADTEPSEPSPPEWATSLTRSMAYLAKALESFRDPSSNQGTISDDASDDQNPLYSRGRTLPRGSCPCRKRTHAISPDHHRDSGSESSISRSPSIGVSRKPVSDDDSDTSLDQEFHHDQETFDSLIESVNKALKLEEEPLSKTDHAVSLKRTKRAQSVRHSAEFNEIVDSRKIRPDKRFTGQKPMESKYSFAQDPRKDWSQSPPIVPGY
ncbi:unnamed protein product [Ranitomeya imitator]|uniref:Uncharacterized protein n=1 Tax=Ranitomeya imitator TaxID=111125 RepID=A0ABN9MKQ3_9NEOB|nr:unnamed protein product [Ranitomeya imitator]